MTTTERDAVLLDDGASGASRRALALMAPVALWAVPAVLFWLVRQDPPDGGERASGVQGFVALSWPWGLCALFTPAILAAGRRAPLVGLAGWRAILLHVGAMLLCITAFALLGTAFTLTVGDPFAPADEGPAARLARVTSNGAPFMAVMYWLILGVGGVTEARRELARRTLESTRMEAQLGQARLAALSAQLRPHFLFNTLNGVSALVRKGQDRRAVRMLAHLADLLRHSLRHPEGLCIPLHDEFDMLRAYLAVEQERVGERMAVQVQLGAGLEGALVPPMLLQPLVENAVRHGVVPWEGACEVRITAAREGERLAITIVNDGVPLDGSDRAQPTPAPSPGPRDVAGGVGLRNTRERLTTVYGAEASFRLERTSSGATVAALQLPLRPAGDLPWRLGDDLTRHPGAAEVVP